MVSVPGFLLRRLYVKGSLKNAPVGFEFQLMNSLGSGYSTKVWPLTVDGQEIPVGQTYFIVGDKETPFGDVSPDNTFALEVNKSITIWADAASLERGVHKIEMCFDVPGLGSMRFDFTDEVADG